MSFIRSSECNGNAGRKINGKRECAVKRRADKGRAEGICDERRVREGERSPSRMENEKTGEKEMH